MTEADDQNQQFLVFYLAYYAVFAESIAPESGEISNKSFAGKPRILKFCKSLLQVFHYLTLGFVTEFFKLF